MTGTCNTAATVVAGICGDPSMADEVRRGVAAAGEPRPVNAREALEICREEISDLLKYWGPFDGHVESKLKELVIKCDAGLSAPTRNCDVGTAEEQTHRFDRHCDKYLLNRDEDEECVGCPLVNMAGHCELNWAQMPYESEAGK